MSEAPDQHNSAKTSKRASTKAQQGPQDVAQAAPTLSAAPAAAETPRRRGRPPGSGNKNKKITAAEQPAEAPASETAQSAAEPKRRGRPRKQPLEQPQEAAAAEQTSHQATQASERPDKAHARVRRQPQSAELASPEPPAHNAGQERLQQDKFRTPRRNNATPLRPQAHKAPAQNEQAGAARQDFDSVDLPQGEPRQRHFERPQRERQAGGNADFSANNFKNNKNQRFRKQQNNFRNREQREQQGFEQQAPNEYAANPRGSSRFAKQHKRQQFVRAGEPANKQMLQEAGDTQNYPTCEVSGVLEITPKGFGFLNEPLGRFDSQAQRVWVSMEIIRRFALREAQMLEGTARITPQGVQLLQVNTINGIEAEQARSLPNFEDLKAVNPSKRIVLEGDSNTYSTRVIDIIAPIARGQRGLIVAPPRSGKTVLLHDIAAAITQRHKDIKLLLLLIDERPEEVTEFRRDFGDVEIYASSNDSHPREHMRIAQLCIERAKRMVEAGQHAVILMDSITRLSRAYNNYQPGSGRTMSGGIDARALEVPRRLFAAARDTREAGSLTIVATALVETNSRMDDLIFQEFKGTGNMELVLNRKIAEMYIFPAIDILKSGTRREELILPELVLSKVRLLRRALSGHRPSEAMERLLFFLKKYASNAEMMINIKTRD